jgi:hypothetical protein
MNARAITGQLPGSLGEADNHVNGKYELFPHFSVVGAKRPPQQGVLMSTPSGKNRALLPIKW